ncbi:hypothetical protein I2501_36515 [Streptacidiphilus sp. NEAU-YB345]|uniref:Uncharacterized protein n=1 Tax=Streptacidiphilus fuscans TaxID=2789292 RepID=A0A931FHE7_9ACTN|nr:hypothetical protein [Streptacidiphilus fuscans]
MVPRAAHGSHVPHGARAAWVEDVQDVLCLSEAIDEAVHEGGRMRAFALAELVRYRAALPGSAGGYLERLEEAVADGYLPDSDDLSALRALGAMPCATAERNRRQALRRRCAELAEASVRKRLDGPSGVPRPALPEGEGREPAAQLVALSAPRGQQQVPERPSPGPLAPIGGAAQAVPEIPRPPRIASVLSGGKVADFARANRPARLREKTRAESYPLPIRRGGTIAMSSNTERPTPASTPASESDPQRRTPARPAADRPVRPIPTPGDLFPRGVRPNTGQDEELATGTG